MTRNDREIDDRGTRRGDAVGGVFANTAAIFRTTAGLGLGEVEPQAINSPAYAIRPPLPGRPGYLDMIRYIDDGVKYIDPYAEFFISYDGQMCFRGLVNRQQAYFENYQNYWCMYPTAVNNVEALENNISYVDTVRIWCVLAAPQCARRTGFPNFLDHGGWIITA